MFPFKPWVLSLQYVYDHWPTGRWTTVPVRKQQSQSENYGSRKQVPQRIDLYLASFIITSIQANFQFLVEKILTVWCYYNHASLEDNILCLIECDGLALDSVFDNRQSVQSFSFFLSSNESNFICAGISH